jgi:uncharacterized lipoprotein YddW (UPF0748 family)
MNTEAKVRAIVAHAVEWGITDLLVEARYRGDALYTPNRIYNTFPNPEPKSHILRENINFDALGYFLELTRDKNIRVHAWVTVNVTTPRVVTMLHRSHLFHTKPQWFTYDSRGNIMSHTLLEGAYVDPGIPEVQDYLVNVFSDIVQNYDIAGLHLDYIRYPGPDFGHHPTSIARFHRLKDELNISTIQEWKELQIYELVKKIGSSIKSVNPNIIYSAATMPNVEHGRRSYAQNWYPWLEEKIVDYIYIMAYTTRNEDFSRQLANIPVHMRNNVIVGVRAWSDDGSYSMQSLRDKLFLIPSEYNGVCFFSYGGIIDRRYQPVLIETRRTAIGSGNLVANSIYPRDMSRLTTYVPKARDLTELITTRPNTYSTGSAPFPRVERPRPEHMKFEGHVFGFNEVPLRGARIVSKADPRLFTFSDSNGYFIINAYDLRDHTFVCSFMNFSQTIVARPNVPITFTLSVFPTQIYNFNFSGASTGKGNLLFWDTPNEPTVSLYRKSLSANEGFSLVRNFDATTNFFYDQAISTAETYEYQLIRDASRTSFIVRIPSPPNQFVIETRVHYRNEFIQVEIINHTDNEVHWFLNDMQSNTLANGIINNKAETLNVSVEHLPRRFLILDVAFENERYNQVIDLLDIRER